MARKVTGFLSETGQFHETEEAADFHDATLSLRKTLLKHFHNDKQSNDELEKKCNMVHEFINSYTDVVYNFIQSRDVLLGWENKYVSVQPSLEVQEENTEDPDISGDGGNRTERSESEGEDTELVHRRSTGDTRGLAVEGMGTTVQDQRSEEANNNVEGDDKTEGRVSEDGDSGGSSPDGGRVPHKTGRQK